MEKLAALISQMFSASKEEEKMSGSDEVEEMDTTPVPTPPDEPATSPVPPPSSDEPSETSKTSSQDEEGIQLVLSVKWSENAPSQKLEFEMQRLLQSWFNIRKSGTICSAVKILEDGRVLISLKSPPALVELQKLNGETLSSKRGHTVEITSVSLTSELETQIPEKASMNHPSISEPQHESVQQREPRHLGSSAAVSTAGMEKLTCSLPVNDFWYVSHVYQEEINRIEKENGVKITAEVKVTLPPEQDGDPHTALSKFTDLVQTCLDESNASIVPLKYVDPEEWKDALKIIQKTENQLLLLTLSSEHMTIFGPSQSQAAFSKSLNAAQKTFPNTSTTFGESAWASQDAPLKIGMNINDPLVNDGITMEQNHWRLMTTSYSRHVDDIKAKFGVDFKESDNGQGKVTVKACYNRSEGNVLMESHAVRAFLNLFQRFTTTPMSLTQQYGASGFTDPSKNLNNNYQSEGASSGPVFNGRSIHNEEGATAGGSEDDNCPICIYKFTNKKQLKCKHEFCEECLEQAVSSMGPICPVCKDVFGPIEGDQPDGKMSWKSVRYSLPGFPYYGTIQIDYDIPSGIQMEKHPNPGRTYSGISRTAYLPDNKEGNDVLCLLKKAFDQKLIFTIGMSRTTGLDDQVIWNDIHHKTSTGGGPENVGYPDPNYLSRVREELKAKGIK